MPTDFLCSWCQCTNEWQVSKWLHNRISLVLICWILDMSLLGGKREREGLKEREIRVWMNGPTTVVFLCYLVLFTKTTEKIWKSMNWDKVLQLLQMKMAMFRKKNMFCFSAANINKQTKSQAPTFFSDVALKWNKKSFKNPNSYFKATEQHAFYILFLYCLYLRDK